MTIMLNRSRGLIGAFANRGAPADVFAELESAFADFKKKHNGELGSLATEVDRINEALAAMRIGGAAGDGEGMPRNQAQAISAVVDFMRSGKTDAMAAMAAARSMSTDSNPDGGFTVPAEIDRVIQNQLIQLSPLRGLATIVRTSSAEYKKIINRRGASSGWVSEREDRPPTDTPVLGEITPPIGEIYAEPEITQRLLDDSSFDLAAFLADNVSDEFALQEGAAFVNGDGNEKPRGFLTAQTTAEGDATRQFGKLQYTPTGVAAAISDATHNGGDALIALVHSLRAPYRAGPGVGWLMNSSTAAVVRKLKVLGEVESYLWQPSMVVGQPDQLLGYPVYEDENMQDIGANSYPIAFGNWKRGYTIVDRSELRLLRDPYTRKGWVRFYFTKRVGGARTDSNAIKLLKVAAN